MDFHTSPLRRQVQQESVGAGPLTLLLCPPSAILQVIYGRMQRARLTCSALTCYGLPRPHGCAWTMECAHAYHKCLITGDHMGGRAALSTMSHFYMCIFWVLLQCVYHCAPVGTCASLNSLHYLQYTRYPYCSARTLLQNSLRNNNNMLPFMP